MSHKYIAFQNLRSAQVMVIAVAIFVVVGLLAVGMIDVGYILVCRARLQNAADATALAAAQQHVGDSNAGVSEGNAREAAHDEGEVFTDLNWEAARCEIAFGAYQDGAFVEQEDSVQATAVQARTVRDGAAPGGALGMFFAPLVGINSMDVDAVAVAGVSSGIRTIRGSLAPFGVEESSMGAEGEEMDIYPDGNAKLNIPGNFGCLDLDGGSNQTQDLIDWLNEGYPGEVTIDPEVGYVWIRGNPGLVGALNAPVTAKIGDVIFVAIYDQINDLGGNNADFRIVKFAAVKILDAQITGNDKRIHALVQRIVSLPNCETDSSLDDNICKVSLVR